MQPLVDMMLTHYCAVVCVSAINDTALSHYSPLFLCERLQHSSTPIIAESTRTLQTASIQGKNHPSHHTSHSTRATHTRSEKNLHTRIIIYKRCSRMAHLFSLSSLSVFSACCVADLSRGWHVAPSLFCACSALVCMSIHHLLLLPSSFEWSGVNCGVVCKEKSQEAPSQTGVTKIILKKMASRKLLNSCEHALME